MAARAILIGGNAVIHAATGHLPNVDFKNAPGQSLLNVGLYSLETVSNAYGGTAIAAIGAKGLPQLINGWRTWATSSGGVTALNGITENAIAEITVHAERTVGQAASQAAAGTALELAAATAENGIGAEAAKQGGLNLGCTE